MRPSIEMLSVVRTALAIGAAAIAIVAAGRVARVVAVVAYAVCVGIAVALAVRVLLDPEGVLGPTQACHRFGQGVGPARGDHHTGALVDQARGDGQADPPAGTGDEGNRALEPADGPGHRPRSRPMSSFMISFDPAQILVTRASRQARAARYSFMNP